MTNPVANNADQEDLTKWSSSSYSETMGKLGCWSVLDEYKQYILEELEPGQFREKIIPTYGVGIFFQHSMHNGKFVVSHLNPGSAAAMSKRILVGDVLFTLNSEKVAGWDWDKFRKKMFGPAGTFVELDFIRKTSADTAESNSRNNWVRMSFRLNHLYDTDAEAKNKSSSLFTKWLLKRSVGGEYMMVRINLMRGSPEFCHNTSEHGVVQAQQINQLTRMKAEEEILCANIESRIRLESALFDEVLYSTSSLRFFLSSQLSTQLRRYDMHTAPFHS